MGLKVDRIVGAINEFFFKHVNDKKQHRNNTGPLQDEGGHLTNTDMDKSKVFNAFFAFIF